MWLKIVVDTVSSQGAALTTNRKLRNDVVFCGKWRRLYMYVATRSISHTPIILFQLAYTYTCIQCIVFTRVEPARALFFA